MNTPEISIEEQAEAFAAWKRGEEVEYWNPNMDKWIQVTNALYFYLDTTLRRKPQRKLRPWKPEEVPVGAVVRYATNEKSIRMLITSNFEPHILGEVNRWFFVDLLKSMEHSIDGGKTWLPCGVEE